MDRMLQALRRSPPCRPPAGGTYLVAHTSQTATFSTTHTTLRRQPSERGGTKHLCILQIHRHSLKLILQNRRRAVKILCLPFSTPVREEGRTRTDRPGPNATGEAHHSLLQHPCSAISLLSMWRVSVSNYLVNSLYILFSPSTWL